MAPKKQTKVLSKRKKFIHVDVPITRTRVEIAGNVLEDVNNRTLKFDLTRQLRGKSIEATLKIKIEDEKAIALPIKIRLMPYFIRRMIRKRISYIEDSFTAPTQESLVKIKPFIITRKKVSRVVRKTIRNQAKNWIEDYLADKTDQEVFNEILGNRMQKPLSLKLKKTYPLSLCEIRVLEIIRPLEKNEIPKIKPKKKDEIKEREEPLDQGLDQLAEIEEELKAQKVKEAEEEIKKTQDKAEKLEEKKEKPETQPKKEKTPTKKAKPKTTKKKPEDKKSAKKEEKEKKK